jgi:flagellar basal-body rod modification protein FlgD
MAASAVQGIVGEQAQQATAGRDAFSKLDLQSFLKMLIAELRNQDPLNPMNNAEILQQISNIKAIESNQRLSDTLEALMLQQNLAAAYSMLNSEVSGLSSDGKNVAGKAEGVLIHDGVVNLRVGQMLVPLKNVREVRPPDASAPPSWLASLLGRQGET